MPQTHFQKAVAAAEAQNYELALSEFSKVIELAPSQSGAYYNRALVHGKMNQYALAIPDFDKAIELEPQNATFYSDRGVAKFHTQQLQEALKDMDKAQALEPENAFRYSSRAFIKAASKDIFGAIDDYKKAIELDPQDAIAYNNLGLLEEQLGYTKNAKQKFAKADELAGDKPQSDISGKPSQKIPDSTEKVTEKNLSESAKQNQAEETNRSKPSVWSISKEVFTKKETFQEFISFVKKKFS